VLSYELKVASFVREIGLSGNYLADPHSGFGAEASGSIATEIVWNHCCSNCILAAI
jgi:hypothetical protein